MEKQILVLTTTCDFLYKFERQNIQILQQMGYVIHYAANMREPAYFTPLEQMRESGIQLHDISIARSPFLFRTNYQALRQILHIIRENSIQIIHCHTPVGGVLGRLAGRLVSGKKPIVLYTAHGFHFFQGAPLFNRCVYYTVEKFLAGSTDVLLVINDEDEKAAKHFTLRKNGMVVKIPGTGLDIEAFAPLRTDEWLLARKKLGISPDTFFLVSVGELNKNKNHDVVLKALAELQRKNTTVKLHYGICGDGFFRAETEQQLTEMALSKQVSVYGYCTNIRDIVGCADVMVFPSIREGLGMAALEALALGIPVIASDNRGTREYMRHGANGFVCRYDDVDSFAQYLEQISRMSVQERSTMRENCLKTVQPFSSQYTAIAMRKVYQWADEKICKTM